MLVLAWLLAHGTVMTFATQGKRCFEKVDLMTNTSLPPFNGEMYRVVREPFGYVVNVVWLVGIFLGLFVFRTWAGSRQRPLRNAASDAKVGVGGVGASSLQSLRTAGEHDMWIRWACFKFVCDLVWMNTAGPETWHTLIGTPAVKAVETIKAANPTLRVMAVEAGIRRTLSKGTAADQQLRRLVQVRWWMGSGVVVPAACSLSS